MAEDYGLKRLGGPPGLFDSPNWDRESTGGIVQRVRVPESPKPEQLFGVGVLSLNDSDSLRDAMERSIGLPDKDGESAEELNNLEQGIPFRKSIAGSNM